jgi:tetratricopeptide (TPR) repeat protein
MPESAPEPPPAKPAPGKRATAPTPQPKQDRAPMATPTGDDTFVNLGDWLREDEGPKDTRMVVAEEEPTGNEEADFADMLRKFKQGVAENVEDEDYQSHYDLGVAYKEMGLVDEAIAEFQKALRGPQNRVRTYESIGQCFIEKGQNSIAATILARALNEKGQTDDQLVGVLYLLGRANEALGKHEEAMQFYQRVFVVDIQFHDVADRLNALENAAR